MADTASQNRRTPLSTPPAGRSSLDRAPATLWPEILRRIANDRPEFLRGWFFRLKPRSLDAGTLTIEVENDAQASYLNTRCRGALSAAAQTTAGRLIAFSFTTASEPSQPGPKTARNPDERGTSDPSQTFDSFAVGPCNRFAAAAAQAFAKDDSDSDLRLLFLQGPPGTGKTHLLSAICHSIAGSTEARWRYVSAETFCRNWIESVESGNERAFRAAHRELDCLIVDDLDCLSQRQRSQEEFFHTLNALQDLRARVAVSTSAPLVQLSGIELRIRDRLTAGFIATLELPCTETRAAIVRSIARSRCIDIAEPAIAALAEPDGSSAADVVAALSWLDAQSRTTGGRITEGLAREWLAWVRVAAGTRAARNG